MNINQKIAELNPGGFPKYNRKINELIEAINWLLAMRSTAGQISEGGRGPVIPGGGGAATTPPQPWVTDPDVDPAGWSKITCLNLVQDKSFEVWIWTGQVSSNILPIPWLVDPNGVAAQWVQHQVCVGGNIVNKWFWGTP